MERETNDEFDETIDEEVSFEVSRSEMEKKKDETEVSGNDWKERFERLEGQMMLLMDAVNNLTNPGRPQSDPNIQNGQTMEITSEHVETGINRKEKLAAINVDKPYNSTTGSATQNIHPAQASVPFVAGNIGSANLSAFSGSNAEFEMETNRFIQASDKGSFCSNNLAANNAWSRVSGGLVQMLIPEHFSGEFDSNPTKFLKQMKKMLGIQSFSRDQFLILLNTIMTGRAATWLNNIQGQISSPDDFLNRFRNEFMSDLYMRNLRFKIAHAKQDRNEGIVNFVDKLCFLYAQLPDETPDATIIETIMMGLQREPALHLCNSSFKTVGEMRAKCYQLDALLGKRNEQSKNSWSSGDKNRVHGQNSQQNENTNHHFQPRQQTGYGNSANRYENYNRDHNGYNQRDKSYITCYGCYAKGHYRYECPEENQGNGSGAPAPIAGGAGSQ